MAKTLGDMAEKLEKMAELMSSSNASDLTAKGPDGKWTRKPLAYRVTISVHLCVTRPPEICVQLVFKHIHSASGYTIRR